MSDLQREALSHFERGNVLDESGDRDGAIAEWLEAAHLDPRLAAAHYNLGVAFADQGDSQIAIEQLREAAALDPFDSEARVELAGVLLAEQQADAAIEQLRQVLSVFPGNTAAARFLAEILLDQESWDEAAAALEASGMGEEDVDLWLELGGGYEDQCRYQDAILAYRRALVCQPENLQAIRALSVLHAPTEEPPASDED